MSSLYVLLPLETASADTEFDYVLSTDGLTPGAHASSSAPRLPATTGAGAQTVAVAPAEALSWHQVELPKGIGPQSSRLRSVLEGLLEDQLLDEPESLHFAIEPQARAGQPVWVAVCQRAWLRAALQTLEAAGRPISRVVPEVAPAQPGALHASGEPEQARLLASGPGGVTVMPLAAGVAALLPGLDDQTPCFAEPAVASLAESALQRPVVLQTAPQRWLQAAQSRWDLAQFEFASSGRTRALKKVGTLTGEFLHARQWRAARWGAALLVLANVVGVNAWALRERAALAAKQDAVRSTLTTTFPQVRLVVNPTVQMEREVAALRQATGGRFEGDLESLLTALARVAGDRSISGLEFTGSELRVRGLGWSPAQLQAAQPELKRQGIAARMQGELLVLSPEASS
ncbi:type II secretion system protein GspL [Ramlibacter rhizophilus]|uniref:General secretion pathway protein GspL n=1 Tax=Ramlibacter rhizophilus TaxID=1781167 RepID=A0A4Z0BES2_9BURK|nr:type II secretion system protein GspL [Ramlibacter rhizophilus]TFY97310.1 general secretion pathway protein GspL [Ramlibacter rhizophilus]